MRRALILVLASAASAEDPPPQCEGFGSCLATGNIGRAVAHGLKDAADEMRKGSTLSKIGAVVIDGVKKETTSEKPNDGTCHKERGSECKEGEVVVYASHQGVLLKFGKYKGGGKKTECKNAHDETKKPQPAKLRRATPAEIKIFEDDVAAFERWKKGGKEGEKPEMRTVAKYLDEGSTVDEKAIETDKDKMLGILDFVAFTGATVDFRRSDPLSVYLAFEQYLSKAIPGHKQKYYQKTLAGASPAKRKQLRDAQVEALKDYAERSPRR